MSLLDLPLDVISLVIDILERDESPASLCPLALTCRALYSLAGHLIQKRVSLPVPSRKFKLFHWSITHIPNYGHKVLSMTIVPSRDERVDHEVQLSFLCGLPNLRVLKVDSPSRGISTEWMCTLSAPVLPLRRTLMDISFSSLGKRHMATLMLYPELRRLKTDLVTSLPTIESHFPPSDLPHFRAVHLEHLNLSDSYVPCHFLENLLACTPSLKSLWCNIPIRTKSDRLRYNWESEERTKPPPMSDIQNIIQLVSSTLTKLDLYTGMYKEPGYIWTDDDIGRLDLRAFPVLRSLSASAILFLGSSLRDYPREGMYARLPSSLENLCLSFCYDIWIFYLVRVTGDQARPPYVGQIAMNGRRRFLRQELHEKDYFWILELAQNKEFHLPCLRTVQLYEVTYWHRDSLQLEKWIPPDSVTSAFRHANVHLNVHVRSPLSFKSGITWSQIGFPLLE
ncbi:hypothetical protein K469DRAFT_124076 [Zopfia rhizophila CBS 207.26]|uniref:F-box domain-containing protein n=1 Tax=Zopfia rhizophila CBS 207.26 TaxID=1314779 RepID=A0A6A6E5C1_9PEZI|nr:hypothetical protein K469DRAFT_124076 [Zopfia rhizophila CBS 207.26]